MIAKSLMSETAKNWMPLISSCFASAETSIPKVALGFAKWHPDSHFWMIFGSFCRLAIPQPKNGILIQDKNRAAATDCDMPLSLNSGSVRGTWWPRVLLQLLTTVVP
jgi:hypothetical protein